jgi:hypothetical protein
MDSTAITYTPNSMELYLETIDMQDHIHAGWEWQKAILWCWGKNDRRKSL